MREDKYRVYVETMQGHPSIAHTNKDAEGMKHLLEVLPRNLDDDALKRVLAIGCADGAEVRALIDLGYDAQGITYGQNNVDYGRKKYKVKLQVMDMHDLKFRPASFDYAYSSHSFEHAFAPILHIMEVFITLRKGGRWFLTHPAYVLDAVETHAISHHHPNVLPAHVHGDMFKVCGFNILDYQSKGEGKEDQWLLEKPENIIVHDGVKCAYINRFNAFKQDNE